MKQLVFVVEDEFDVCELAQQHLEEAGYTVRTFSTADIIHEAENRRPSLMLIALMMPDGNGFDLCRRIRDSRILATTPVMFLIPQTSEHYRAFALESGADDCIIKPFSPRELVAGTSGASPLQHREWALPDGDGRAGHRQFSHESFSPRL